MVVTIDRKELRLVCEALEGIRPQDAITIPLEVESKTVAFVRMHSGAWLRRQGGKHTYPKLLHPRRSSAQYRNGGLTPEVKDSFYRGYLLRCIKIP
jgi:hypothetical protein